MLQLAELSSICNNRPALVGGQCREKPLIMFSPSKKHCVVRRIPMLYVNNMPPCHSPCSTTSFRLSSEFPTSTGQVNSHRFVFRIFLHGMTIAALIKVICIKMEGHQLMALLGVAHIMVETFESYGSCGFMKNSLFSTTLR